MPTPRGGRQGVRLSPEGIRKVMWQMDIRCWSRADLAREAEVTMPTVREYLAGNYIHRINASKFQQAFAATPPIPGLADLLEREPEVAS